MDDSMIYFLASLSENDYECVFGHFSSIIIILIKNAKWKIKVSLELNVVFQLKHLIIDCKGSNFKAVQGMDSEEGNTWL